MQLVKVETDNSGQKESVETVQIYPHYGCWLEESSYFLKDFCYSTLTLTLYFDRESGPFLMTFSPTPCACLHLLFDGFSSTQARIVRYNQRHSILYYSLGQSTFFIFQCSCIIMSRIFI